MNTNQPTEQDDTNPVNPTVVGTSRRDWLRRGAVAATPVVASLASAPVYAAAGTCVLPSGFLSANTFTSRHPGATTCAGDMGPSHWKSTSTTWPSAAARTATFLSVFGPNIGSISTTATLETVVGGTDDFSRYCVAAYLIAVSSPAVTGYPLTSTQVIDIWKSYNGGTKSAILVGSWTTTDVVTWLKSLMNA